MLNASKAANVQLIVRYLILIIFLLLNRRQIRKQFLAKAFSLIIIHLHFLTIWQLILSDTCIVGHLGVQKLIGHVEELLLHIPNDLHLTVRIVALCCVLNILLIAQVIKLHHLIRITFNIHKLFLESKSGFHLDVFLDRQMVE